MDFDFTLPGLGKPESSRPKRVAEAIKNELSVLLLQTVSDPRLAEVSISHVMATPDLKQAKVYFIVSGGADIKAAKKAMLKAKGFFRSHLAKALDLRYTPDLLFFYDEQQEEVDRIDELFRQIDREKGDEGS
ncbi:30S ribosome-binding factor RbfA [Desulfogranum mediterraneum]|uniref:30S ribosome-binding factor RbfA n=1 Tax=Desulfogranum mediterraneum TaxID=160661 RepID=UPI0003FD7C2B|nr:30S ribosome-binding factor RbfA [Desulfogranum mediterraneum]